MSSGLARNRSRAAGFWDKLNQKILAGLARNRSMADGFEDKRSQFNLLLSIHEKRWYSAAYWAQISANTRGNISQKFLAVFFGGNGMRKNGVPDVSLISLSFNTKNRL